MKHRRRRWLAAAALAALAQAPARADVDPVYAALRAARPTGAAYAVTNWTLERDAFRFQFASGTFQLFPSVAGRVVGAVFVGEGTVTLEPATPSERRQLAMRVGDPRLEVLTDRFDSCVLLFTDGTANDIAAHGTPAAPSTRAADVFERFFKKQRRDLKNDLHVRLLRDVRESPPPEAGVFIAYFDAKKLPPALAIVDPKGLASHFSSEVGGECVALYVMDDEKGGFWYLAPTAAAARSGRPAEPQRRADAAHYAIETAIQKNARIRGTTTITFAPLVPGMRVLSVSLHPKLRVSEAAFSREEDADWTPLPFVQEKEDEDSDLAVVFPDPLPEGRVVRLRLSYEGKDVLQDAGDGNFVVGARDSWYPNLGTFTDVAAYDLDFRCPKSYQIVSVGEPVEDRVESDERISRWRTSRPIRVAGFNYGRFKRLERKDAESGVDVRVFTNPGEPDFVRELNFYLENRPDAGLRHISASAASLADSAMADGINTARVGSLYYGALPAGPVSITQQTQAFFGQSWPTLIYLPYIAAFDSTIRHELGLQDAADFVDLVGPHEFAHQWWGHRVGWESYRDQWLSEGFAEFTAALVLQYTGGLRKANGFWEKARRWITMKPRYASIANDEAGPISDGYRTSTWRNRSAAQAMIYSKGAYVVHMLRMLLRDSHADPPDANFIALMKDFVAAETDKNPTTRDFEAAVARHANAALDPAGDGKVDWFFRQWVEGMEIPRFRSKLDVAHAGDGLYRIRGTISQEGVSADFRSPVALYAEFHGEVLRVALVPIVGSTTLPIDLTVKLPETPDRILVNALHDVLSRD